MPRPSCPKHHTGRVWLDGHAFSRDKRYERTRFRCVPDNGDPEHVYVAPLPARRRCDHTEAECPECEHRYARADGLVTPWHFSLAVREIAKTLYEIGLGTNTYRDISERRREDIGRLSRRGMQAGMTSTNANIAIDYLDAFGDVVSAGPDHWPRIIALDSRPVLVPNHSSCCGSKLKKRQAKQSARGEVPEPPPMWSPLVHDWPATDRKGRRRDPPKTKHSSRVKVIGHVLVAVGYESVHRPHLWLVRFMGGGDQESWAEFLRTLPGTPEWVVSDRDAAISGAVADVWGGQATHYFCEQHIAANAMSAAVQDGFEDQPGLRQMIEQAQWSMADWEALEDAARSTGAPHLLTWLAENHALAERQIGLRHDGYPRSAGATEASITEIERRLDARFIRFRNADRLDRLLALVRADLEHQASVGAYSMALRRHFAAQEGRANVVWDAQRDRGKVSSLLVQHIAAVKRARAASKTRQAPILAERRRGKVARATAERAAKGLPALTRGLPHPEKRTAGSVAGKTLADFPEPWRSGTRQRTAASIRGPSRQAPVSWSSGTATRGLTMTGRRKSAHARSGRRAAASARTGRSLHHSRSPSPTRTWHGSGTPPGTAT